jgi:hypothetical protein
VTDAAGPAAALISAPEFRLASACCRRPLSEAGNAAIRAAAARVGDWSHFASLVKRQRVAGLAHEALATAGIDLPSPFAAELAALAARMVRRNLVVAGETVRLCRTLAAAGIPVLVLKGIALAQLVYGAIETKQTRDIDLLVPPDRAEAALRILEKEGYALFSPAAQLNDTQRRALIRHAREIELARNDIGLRLELQWRVADNALLLDGIGAHSPAQTVTLAGGGSVRTLALDPLFAYLCVHGAGHAWSRLKWLADLNALVAQHAADIPRLYRQAQTLGAGLCAGQALLLCRQLLDLPLPPGLANELQADNRIARLVRGALVAMTAPNTGAEKDAGFAGVLRNIRMQFSLGRGFRFFAAQCRVAAVGQADIALLALPAGLQFLHPLLRLPLWLWRRATSAIGARQKTKKNPLGVL